VLCASGTPQGRHLRADSLHVAFFFWRKTSNAEAMEDLKGVG
jgi:hypothetical protein